MTSDLSGAPRPHQLIAPVPGTGHGLDIPGTEPLSARRAHQHRIGDRAATFVDDLDRRSRGGGMTVSPLSHGGEDGPEIPPLVGEPVVVARRVLGIRDPGQHALLDQPPEALLQDVAGDPEPTLEVVEATDPQEGVPDDEHAPPLAHDLEALGNGAVHVGEALSFHACDRSGLHDEMQSRKVRSVTGPSTHRGGSTGAVGARRPTVFVVTALGAFMASLDLSIVNVAFPALERSFPHDSRAALAWVITGYSIVFASLLVTAGRTADRIGRRRVFFAGLAVFSLGSALCGLAPSVSLLVVGRLVQGAGAAAMLPSSLGLLLGAFPTERRSQVVAMWGGVGALAVATGPSLGAGLISAGGWRWAFYVNLPVGAVAFLLGRRVLADSKSDEARARPDYLGVALVSAALASLVLAISEGPAWGWSSGRVVASFFAAAVLGTAFLYRSSRHVAPVLDLSLFSARSFSVANAATLLYAMGFFAMLLGNILFLTSVWHYSILRAGLAVTPGPLVVAAVSGPAGRLATRVGFRRVLLVGTACFAGGLVWYATRIGVHPAYLKNWLPATLITGLGIGLTFPVLSAAAVSSLHQERFAVGSAVNQTARQVGGALGVALLVVILGTPHSALAALGDFRHLWWYAASMAAASGLASSLLRRTDAAPSRPVTVNPEIATRRALVPGLSAVPARPTAPTCSEP